MIFNKIKHLLHRVKQSSRKFSGNYQEFGLKISVYIWWYEVFPVPKSIRYRKAMYCYIEKIIEPVLKIYKEGIHTEISPAVQKKFEKIPIWICWFQGETNMPELVKICYKSVCNNIPEKYAEVHLLSLGNLSEYIQLSETIMKKFETGTISYAFFSDIIRYHLIRDYGGIWIDSTIYVSGKIQDEWLYREYYTMHMHKELCPLEPCEGRWTNFCFSGKKENTIACYICDALEFFWNKAERVPDYIFLDYILMAGYRNVPKMKALIDAVPYNNEMVWNLKNVLEDKFDLNTYQKITESNIFHKLAHQVRYSKMTDEKQMTFYGYLCKNTFDRIEL